MKTASDLRAEADRIREFALGCDDPDVLEELQTMIEELEVRARAFGDGDAGER